MLTRTKVRLASFIGVLLWLAVPLTCHAATSADPARLEPYRVLVLSPFGQGSPAFDAYINSLASTLKSTGLNGDDIYIEYLDLGRNSGPEYRQLLNKLLAEKYAKRKINVIVTLTQPALDFLLRDNPELMPEAPIIAVRTENLADLPRGRHPVVVMAQQLDYRTSFLQALALFPATNRVHIIIGASESEKQEEDELMTALAPWKDRIVFSDTSNLSIEDAERQIASLPPHTIIYALGIRQDAVGHNFVANESALRLAHAANAPVFVLYDVGIGDGYIGGYLFSVKKESVRAASLAYEIMSGTFTLNKPVIQLNAEQVSMYDWQQLERWKADPDRLPHDTIFINRPPTLWGQYRNTVIATAAAFTLLTMLIAALMWQIRRKTLAEEALTASQERYRTLVEEAPEAIAVYDADMQRIIEHNSKAERLFGRPREVLLGIDIKSLFVTPETGDGLEASIAENTVRALQGESLVFERTVRQPGDKLIPCEVWLSRLPSKDHKLLRASVIDITERKNAEAELLRHRQKLEEQVVERTAALSVALDQAQAANRAKSTFLSHMSHEIRTPMNAILGYTQLMERLPELTGKLKDYTAVIARSGDHLMSLINDVLEMSKIEAGSATLSQEDFNIRALLKDVESMFKMRAAEKGLALNIRIADEAPEQLFADAIKVRQVLVNLVGNAIKFTDSGKVEVDAAVHFADGHGLLVDIRVADTGPGIPQHEQARVFEAFEQTASGYRQGGTGLGMAISRQYARMMGGDVSLDSTARQGAIVRFTFFAQPGKNGTTNANRSGGKRIAALAPGSAQPKILIVDDIESNRDILRLMLADIGVTSLRDAAEGKDAVALAEQWRPDIVMLDRRMPDADGLDIARAIRELPGSANVRIIMVTASAFEEDRRLAFAAGVDGFVGKPFHEQEIFMEIQRVFPGIAYRYEDETPPTGKENDNSRHIAELAQLDGKLVTELIDLIESGDAQRFDNYLAAHVRDAFPGLYQHLHELVLRFDYARILAALKPVGSDHETS